MGPNGKNFKQIFGKSVAEILTNMGGYKQNMPNGMPGSLGNFQSNAGDMRSYVPEPSQTGAAVAGAMQSMGAKPGMAPMPRGGVNPQTGMSVADAMHTLGVGPQPQPMQGQFMQESLGMPHPRAWRRRQRQGLSGAPATAADDLGEAYSNALYADPYGS